MARRRRKNPTGGWWTAAFGAAAVATYLVYKFGYTQGWNQSAEEIRLGDRTR